MYGFGGAATRGESDFAVVAVLSSVIERKSHGEDPGGSILRDV